MTKSKLYHDGKEKKPEDWTLLVFVKPDCKRCKKELKKLDKLKINYTKITVNGDGGKVFWEPYMHAKEYNLPIDKKQGELVFPLYSYQKITQNFGEISKLIKSLKTIK